MREGIPSKKNAHHPPHESRVSASVETTNTADSSFLVERKLDPEYLQLVIDEVRSIFGDDELAERVLREPGFARRLLEGEPFNPRSMFEAVRAIKELDPELGYSMIDNLHARGAIGTIFGKEGEVQFAQDEAEEQERARLDRLLFIALNKSGFREEELIKEHGEETMITRAVAHANDLRRACGVEPIGITPDDYRIMPKGSIGQDTAGVAVMGEEEMFVVRKRSALAKLKTIVHEALHFASDTAMTYRKSDNLDYPYQLRSGMSERASAEPFVSAKLKWLDEAITEELAARFIRGLSSTDPDFGRLVEARQDALAQYNANKDEIRFPEGESQLEEPIDVEFSEDGKVLLDVVTYRDARLDLWKLATDIATKNPAAFEGKSVEDAKEQIFNILTKAKFTGNIIPFALLYDAAFGKDAFKIVMNDNPDGLRSEQVRDLRSTKRESLAVFKDDSFPGFIIVREGNIGYALRKNPSGNIEGNQIHYLEDCSVGAVYKLHAPQLEELTQRGVVDLALFDQISGP